MYLGIDLLVADKHELSIAAASAELYPFGKA
jgi:hypothetical protein